MAELVEEVWTYAGRRESSDGKVSDAWQEPDGTILLFPKKGSHHIGWRYRARVTRDGTVTLHGQPELLSEAEAGRAPEDLSLEWTAKTRTLETRLAAERQAKKQGDALHEACLPLRAMLFETRTRPERAALLAAILTELGA